MSIMDSATLAAIASPRRREIIRLVWQRELAAGDLAEAFDVSWPAVSQHLNVLKGTGLVSERRDGRHRYYSSGPEQVGALAVVLEQMWNADLDRLTELAEADHQPGAAT